MNIKEAFKIINEVNDLVTYEPGQLVKQDEPQFGVTRKYNPSEETTSEDDDVIDAEIVEDEREGSSNDLRNALERQYGLLQAYKKCIDAIMNKSSVQELSKVEKNEIITLLQEWLKTSETYKNEDSKNINDADEYQKYMEFCLKTQGSIQSMLKDIKDSKRLFKADIFKKFEESLNIFKNILTAKLPSGIINTILYSNPFTALIANNFDLIGGVVKGAYKTIKGDKNEFKKTK